MSTPFDEKPFMGHGGSTMKRDSRLSGVLHALLHMAQEKRPLTSETLALAMQTNPVVVRRIMAGLRKRCLVRSEKGHRGGWSLTCDPREITLFDIYQAIGSPEILAMGNRQESPGCLVEQSVNAALGSAFEDAREILLKRFQEVTLAQLMEPIIQNIPAESLLVADSSPGQG